MMIRWSWLLANILIGFVGTAYAGPNISWRIQGSSFLVEASNNENQAYQCSMNYTLSYVEYGVRGSRPFSSNFELRPHFNGIALQHNTSWAASTLTVDDASYNCNPISTPIPIPRPYPSSGASLCPGGLVDIGRIYYAKESGGKAVLALGRVNFPDRFVLDESYKQQSRVSVAGGGAQSSWDGRSGIPDGVHLVATGGHYWSVGIPVPSAGSDGLPELSYNFEGYAKSLTIGVYCGPEGSPGPGCNVSVTVCAKRK